MKLSQIRHNDDITINNIKIYYKDGKKEKDILDRSEIKDYTIIDFEGYFQEIPNKIINNSYISINYNDNQTETIRLKFKRDFTNSNLLFKGKRKYDIKIKTIKKSQSKQLSKNISTTNQEIETPKEEIKVVENVSDIKEELSSIENSPVTLVHDSVLLGDQQEEPKIEKLAEKEEPELETIDEAKNDIINTDEIKLFIKENSLYYEETYIYEIEDEGLMFLYYEELDQIVFYKNDEFMWDYIFNEDRYNCSLITGEDCKNEILETLKKYLVEGGNC